MRQTIIRISMLVTILLLLSVMLFLLTVPVFVTTRREQWEVEKMYFKFKADELMERSKGSSLYRSHIVRDPKTEPAE